jgi:hypothetical protein
MLLLIRFRHGALARYPEETPAALTETTGLVRD